MQEEEGAAEGEMVGEHYQLNGHEFEHIQGDNEGQGSLACCRPWGLKESDMTERMNNGSARTDPAGSVRAGAVSIQS